MLRNTIKDVQCEVGEKAGTNEYVKNAIQLLHGTHNIRNYIPHEFTHSCWGKAKSEIGISNEDIRAIVYAEFQ